MTGNEKYLIKFIFGWSETQYLDEFFFSEMQYLDEFFFLKHNIFLFFCKCQ